MSCDNSSPEVSKVIDEPKSELEKDYEIADMILQFDAEKVGLLSIIKDVPHEKTKFVLRDYLAKTFSADAFLLTEKPERVVKLVDSIAVKNYLTRKLTASIIFSYQFEMIYREENMDEYSK